jgi:hypothetical protein
MDQPQVAFSKTTREIKMETPRLLLVVTQEPDRAEPDHHVEAKEPGITDLSGDLSDMRKLAGAVQ